jgi:DNA-binding transcriptional regulator YbjK
VLADHGARGLTHRAVDQAAGLPPGTTSNYARTREALLTLILARIAELDLAEGAAGVAGSGLADAVARMVHQWIIAFCALAGAGGAAVPSLAELRAQVTSLLASLCGDDAGAA